MRAKASCMNCESGSQAVEAALLMPVFIALLFGILNGANLLWAQLGLQHATERAARCAAINAAICGADDLVKAYAQSQALSANVPDASFTIVSADCGRLVSGSTSLKVFLTSVTVSAQSCFPN